MDYIVSLGGTSSLDQVAGKFHVKKAQLISAGFTVSAPDVKGHSTVSCIGLTKDACGGASQVLTKDVSVTSATAPVTVTMKTIMDYIVSLGGTSSLDQVAGKFHVKKAQLISAGFTVSAPDEKGHSTVSCIGLTKDACG